MPLQLPAVQVGLSSLDPSRITTFGSRLGASLADCMARPFTTVAPMEGVTTKPAGVALLARSRLRYFAVVPSMALATPSDPGLFEELAIMGSPGCVTEL